MNTTDTQELLQAYARDHSEAAFQELVNRYVDLVYSTALRRVTGDTLLAEDVTQEVFTDLARKASSLPANVMLGGWLHRHTGFVASTTMRSEKRRRERERQAIEMNALNQPSDADWEQLAPVLDDALDELEPTDRDALVLRFFERLELRKVGAALGVGDDAAQKRVSRALEKLRSVLVKRGSITLPVTALSLILGTHSVHAAPAGLGTRIGKAAFEGAAASAGAGLIATLLTPGALKLVFGTATAVVLAGAVIFFSLQGKNQPQQILPVQGQSATTNATPAGTNSEPPGPRTAPQMAAKQTDVADSNALQLVIVAADSGKPVPNVPIEYQGWEGTKSKYETLFGNRAGICDVSIPRNSITDLELTTRIDGFADTRLRWHPDHGDVIPTTYTLRLTRPVLIGGTVVDPDGRPVAGAEVSFNHYEEPTAFTLPENHEFGWVQVTTDANGHWSINRVAPEMVHRMYGLATHPDYVESAVSALGDPTLEQQLRAGTFVFHLGQAVTVRGVVLSPESSPISGAEVLVGKRGYSESREGKTATDGSFEVKGCRPGTNLLSAKADGFSATTLHVDLSADSEPFRLTLQRGKVLRVRLINQAGQPVPKAMLCTSAPPIDGVETVQASFNQTSDADGRVVWSNAPDTELEFDIAAIGYMRRNQVKMLPDGQEHVFTLSPALVVSGTVRDADTGELIPGFRLITGWPQMNLVPDATNPGQVITNAVGHWSDMERNWATFAGGKFRLELGEPVNYATGNPDYMLKFESDDYFPFVSRVIAPDEGNVQLDVVLHRKNAFDVSVVLPDGSSAGPTDIGLVSPGAQLLLAPGSFSRQGGVGRADSMLRADADGHFRLLAEPAVTQVIAANPSGYAEANPAALAKNPVLVLQPWGKLEGSYLSGKEPAAGRDLFLQFAQQDPTSISFDFSFKVTTDSQGHFLFPQVPPGKLKIVRLIHVLPNGFSQQPQQPLPDGDVEIRPGETTTKTIGGEGYTVKARIHWPDDATPGKDWNLTAVLGTAPPQWVLDAADNPAAAAQLAAQLQNSPEMKDYARTARQFQAEIANDYATVTVENVPAGDYVLLAGAILNGQGEAKGSVFGHSSRLTVPSDPPNGTLDAGELLLRKPALANR
jgi:RNA polymerase sigma factor (sigma-70 family)